MPDHNYFANLIWQVADLLRGPYRPPQYERVMLPMTVLRRFDCVLAPTKARVLEEHARWRNRLHGDALDARLDHTAGQRFHNHSPLDFEKLKGDPDNIEKLKMWSHYCMEGVWNNCNYVEMPINQASVPRLLRAAVVLSRFTNVRMQSSRNPTVP